ncbi:ribosomal RNA small subunit methyltransferase A [Candidatus Parcubacteria bacterium]|nr:ribosomal RNA small subunit methyltransferase A [Candidatus Parcubacteria bacterium]
MNLLNKTKQICKENNIKPARSRGQNFLINEDVYDLIVDSAKIDKNNTVLEVGSGLGFLTEKLAGKAKKVIAVELDDKLAELLRANLKEKNISNIEVVNEDILDINFKIPNYKVVANLPYNITSVFLRKFLSCDNKPSSMVLMLQKEVAERIIAKPGKMSLLAVSVQFYAKAEIIEYAPKTDFWPMPKVDSAIIKLVGTGHCHVFVGEFEKKFFQLVKIGFSSKRKMLKNNLANGYHINQKQAGEWLKKAGFNEKIRAQEMSVEDWAVLLRYF